MEQSAQPNFIQERDQGTTSVVPHGDIPWVELAEGVELKVLRIDRKTGSYTLMNRFAPGFQTPTHFHFGAVHAYTVSGKWRYLEYDWVSEAGDYVYEPPDTCHTFVVPDDATEPAVLFFTVDKGIDFLDEDGDLMFRQDAETINELYKEALKEAGLPYPDAILQE